MTAIIVLVSLALGTLIAERWFKRKADRLARKWATLPTVLKVYNDPNAEVVGRWAAKNFETGEVIASGDLVVTTCKRRYADGSIELAKIYAPKET